jgi:hypothetical protein
VVTADASVLHQYLGIAGIQLERFADRILRSPLILLVDHQEKHPGHMGVRQVGRQFDRPVDRVFLVAHGFFIGGKAVRCHLAPGLGKPDVGLGVFRV